MKRLLNVNSDNQMMTERYRLFNFVIIMGIFVTVGFTIWNYAFGESDLAKVLTVVIFVYIGTLYLGNVNNFAYYKYAVIFVLFFFVSYFSYNITTDIGNHTIIVWMIIPVTFAYFMAGRLIGVITTSAILLLTSVMYFLFQIDMNMLTYINSEVLIVLHSIIGYKTTRDTKNSHKTLNIDETIERTVNERISKYIVEINALKAQIRSSVGV